MPRRAVPLTEKLTVSAWLKLEPERVMANPLLTGPASKALPNEATVIVGSAGCVGAPIFVVVLLRTTTSSIQPLKLPNWRLAVDGFDQLVMSPLGKRATSVSLTRML